MERRADEAERETVKLKKAEYMKEHLGEIYESSPDDVLVICKINKVNVYAFVEKACKDIIDFETKNAYRINVPGTITHTARLLDAKPTIIIASIKSHVHLLKF